MTRYTSLTFLVLVGGLVAVNCNERGAKGTALLQVEETLKRREARSATTSNLQKMADEVVAQVQSGEQITPEVQTNIDAMLALIVTVRNEINLDYQAAQTSFEEKVHTLRTSTAGAVHHYTVSKSADAVRFDCFGAEKVLLQTWEDLSHKEQVARAYKIKMCHITLKTEWAVPKVHFGLKECNVKDTDALTAHDLQKCPPLEDLVAERHRIKDVLTHAKTNHTSATETCAAATAAWQAAKTAMETAWDTFGIQWSHCTNEEYKTENAMCEFGVAYQEKCADLADLVDFTNKVKQTKGTNHSETDREAEWNAMVRIKCLLVSYDTSPSPSFNEAKKNACLADNTNDYPNGFEFQTANVTTLSTGTNYDCTEATITFHGQAYSIVGSGADGADGTKYYDNAYALVSSDYKVNNKDYPVNKLMVNDPFAFCAPDTRDNVTRDHAR